MSFRLPLLCLVLSLTTGCAVIRASSRDFLKEEESQRTLAQPPLEVARKTIDLFSKRGYHLVDRKEVAPGGFMMLFRGARNSVTTVSGGQYYVSGSSSEVGSVYYAVFEPVEPGSCRLMIFGKPTAQGSETCSDHDGELFKCREDIYSGAAWHGRQLMTGREEADMIRGLFIEMELEGPAAPAPAQAPAPQTPAPQAVSL